MRALLRIAPNLNTIRHIEPTQHQHNTNWKKYFREHVVGAPTLQENGLHSHRVPQT